MICITLQLSLCDLWQLLLGRKMAFLNVYQWVSHWWWKFIYLYCLLQSYILLSYMAIIVYLSKTFVCKCFIYIDVNMSQSPDRNCPIYSLNYVIYDHTNTHGITQALQKMLWVVTYNRTFFAPIFFQKWQLQIEIEK